jgi:hypothetical protein
MVNTKQIAESGYVLIVHRKGFRSTEVHGRYSHDVLEEAKRRLERREDVQRVVIEDADAFQAREDDGSEHRPWYARLHDDFGEPVNVLDFPLKEL